MNFLQVLQKLKSYTELPEGWNFGSGRPSAAMAMLRALVLLGKGFGFGLDDVETFPGIDGEVQVNFYKDTASLEMIFEIDGTITVTFDEGPKSIRLGENISQEKAVKFLEEFALNKCRSSVSLTSAIIYLTQ